LNLVLPEELISSLAGVAGFSADSFRKVHQESRELVSIRINQKKWNSGQNSGIADHLILSNESNAEKVPWCSTGLYLKERPSFTFDPLFHAGVYYVQEASSMFLEQALKQTLDLSKSLKVLDLCAAPGGKSTHIQSLISADSLLVSNEVIKSRVSILEENVTKWGGINTIITQNDPSAFQKLDGFFDVIVVDAPCSGSGLFRRDPDAIKEWTPDLVNLCSKRQQRILSDILPALKSGGLLIYSTCSYSHAENEKILGWLILEFGLLPVSLAVPESWKIVESKAPDTEAIGYRFYPDKLKGEGFFLACLKKPDRESGFIKVSKKAAGPVSNIEKTAVKKWIGKSHNLDIFKHRDFLAAMPANLLSYLTLLQKGLFIRKAGVTLGRLSGRELIPYHELAVSDICSNELPAIELNTEESIAYLRRDEIHIESGLSGWALVRHCGINLGWIKILGKRINNYYPMEWRILKAART
jgi:16S rRNA C967 or C1407 C5-methylase (RsmB/RsmF family)/NOL1/NOP2/fmu family ribosome biogenesis protein